MSKRLDQDREKELTPKRFAFAINALAHLGYEITYKDDTRLEFIHKGEVVRLYPYSGWHTGKTINDGRGIDKLLNKLKS